MNTPKWIPKQNDDLMRLFDQTRQLERDIRVLGKKYATDINLDFPDYYEFELLLTRSKKSFELCSEIQMKLIHINVKKEKASIERSPYKVLLNKKAFIIRQNLKRRQFQFMYIINRMIRLMLSSVIHSDTIVVDAALLLCTLYNESVSLYNMNSLPSGGALICSNTYASLMQTPKKIDISMILQTISRHRSEQCCLALISCLLITCRPDPRTNDDDTSDSSSVEVLRALTTQLSPINMPENIVSGVSQHHHQQNQLTIDGQTMVLSANEPDIINDPAIKFFDDMANGDIISPKNMPLTNLDDIDGVELLEQLIFDEETNIANVLYKCVKLCPTVFDKAINKIELKKWVERGTRGLWTQVGGTLEHVVLWWSQSPLACRPVNCAKYLRDWLLIVQPDDAPEPILSTLKGLGETLTVHVSSTTWDKQFRLTLVAASLPVDYSYENTEFHCSGLEDQGKGTTPGQLWCDLLQTLAAICNSCDRNGTIPNELPIVEQIPVIHRLDHSIHTMRLWAAAKAKSLSSEWNMNMFFRVINDDVKLCLGQLGEIRFPQLVPADILEVHLEVCVALRAKLISEVKVNIEKLKQTTKECIDVLAAVCETTSLATLSLSFPSPKLWRTEFLQDKPNDYVTYILNQIFLPVIKATKDIEILNLILKILCESWLDHIYMKKVKFSRCGAINLLRDFDGVAEWIEDSVHIPKEHIERLAKHEVLRMCEGVGRILLRKPRDVISILPSPKMIRRSITDDDNLTGDEKPPLPPEMFVPNQQRWLELRARNRTALNFICFCAGETI